MLVESCGGTCPVCGFDQLLMRYGSWGYYMFDACAKCGFAYGANLCDDENWGKEVWKLILHYSEDFLKSQGYPVTREGYYLFLIDHPVEQRESFETVFFYKESKEELINKCEIKLEN